ncbi:MAG: methyltransferase type 11 [Pseudomonadales bacterium]|nr:methyltransferase type 11 [Pseudomonadales bacterium]
MTGFSLDWLNLREAADQRARDGDLLQKAQQWLQKKTSPQSSLTIVDLGAGSGSTLHAFSSFSRSNPNTIKWRLVDYDATLLEEAILRHQGMHELEIYELDLNELSTLPLGGAQLVTASALIDLFSAKFIDNFVEMLLQSSLGLYSALTYDGTTQWTPEHAMDEVVLSALNQDQQRDKGFGVSLGPTAVKYLEQVLSSNGFKVTTASSAWELDGADSQLVSELINGMSNTVAKDPSLNDELLQEWTRFRKENVTTGTCKIGHLDLLALPPI